MNFENTFGLQRHYITVAKVLIDGAGLALAFMLAYLLRFDGIPSEQFVKQFIVLLPYVVGGQLLWMYLSGLSSFSWRFVGLRECIELIRYMVVPSALLLLTRLAAPYLTATIPQALYLQIPIGVILINYVSTLAAVIGVRVLRRVLTERSVIRSRKQNRALVRTVLVGAGHGGLLIAREIEQRPELGIEPVGFLDDDPRKQGAVIHGLRVLGPISSVGAMRSHLDIQQALVTVSNIEGEALRTIVKSCDEAGLPTKIIPGLHEIVGGKARLTRITEVSIEDLLRRKPVELDMHALARFIQGESIIVTGAGGSIGSELCRQVLRFAPRTLIMLERSENALFEIDRELRNESSGVDLVPAVCDITDRERLDEVLRAANPKLILHAAAHKHVPMMEANPAEAIKNNLGGTINLVDLAGEHRVRNLVMISTDKAVNPTSIMGASKRSAELYIQSVRHSYPDTTFASVRFGNVLGSNGSVVPIFKQQIENGGPITVTHPEMRRYFMTIPEASQLVLQAGALSADGEIFILDMGEPVKIVDLAQDLIRLSGLEVGQDIKIEFSGIRPGEKLFEELNDNLDELTKTRHKSIFVLPEGSHSIESDMAVKLRRFASEVNGNDSLKIYRELQSFIPEFTSEKLPHNSSMPLSEDDNVIDISRFSSSS